MNYCTKIQVQNYLLKTIDVSFDSQLNQYIAAMSEYIDSFVGYPLYRNTETEHLYNGSGSRALHIDRVHGTLEVTVDGVEVEPVQQPYNKPVKQGLILREGAFTKGIANVSVTGKHSMCATLPEQISWACTVLVALIVQQVDEQREGVKSEKIGDYTVTFMDDVQRTDFNRAKEILKSYRPIAI